MSKLRDDWRRAQLQSPRHNAHEDSWSGGIRALYDSVAHEPLPAEFVTLLAELVKKTDRA